MPYRRKRRAVGGAKKWRNRRKISDPIKRAQHDFRFVPESVAIREDLKELDRTNKVKYKLYTLPVSKQLASANLSERNSGVTNVGVILASNRDTNNDKNENNEKNTNKTELDDYQMRHLWQSLFYTFWMSDKPFVQQSLAKRLASFIKICVDSDRSLLYIKHFFICMAREWSGIDFLRTDKFFSLVRFFLRDCFEWLAIHNWDPQLCAKFANIFKPKINLNNDEIDQINEKNGEMSENNENDENVLDLMDRKHRGLYLHLLDIYVEELCKICVIDDPELFVPSEVNENDNENQSQNVRNWRDFVPTLSFDALYVLLSCWINIYLKSSDQEQRMGVIRKIFGKLMDSIRYPSQAQRKTNLKKPGRLDTDLYDTKNWSRSSRDQAAAATEHAQNAMEFDADQLQQQLDQMEEFEQFDQNLDQLDEMDQMRDNANVMNVMSQMNGMEREEEDLDMMESYNEADTSNNSKKSSKNGAETSKTSKTALLRKDETFDDDAANSDEMSDMDDMELLEGLDAEEMKEIHQVDSFLGDSDSDDEIDENDENNEIDEYIKRYEQEMNETNETSEMNGMHAKQSKQDVRAMFKFDPYENVKLDLDYKFVVNYDVTVPDTRRWKQTKHAKGNVSKELETRLEGLKSILEQELKSNPKILYMRGYDPLMLQNKCEQMCKTLLFVATQENTPKSLGRKLNALARIFELKPELGGLPDRSALQAAIKAGRDAAGTYQQKNRLKKLIKKQKRRMIRSTKKYKLNKLGIKIKPGQTGFKDYDRKTTNRLARQSVKKRYRR